MMSRDSEEPLNRVIGVEPGSSEVEARVHVDEFLELVTGAFRP
jgi:hypothetical protein